MLVLILQTDTVIIIAGSTQGQIACRVVPRRREVRVGAPQIGLFPRIYCLVAFRPPSRHGARPVGGGWRKPLLTPVANFKL
jgi:hypothetical protein